MADFDKAIPFILKHEGGFVDDKTDRGGATNYGISLRFLQSQSPIADYDFDNDGNIDANDIRIMTKEQACEIYKKCWWDKYGYGRIDNQMVATKLFDMAINMGQKQAVILMQRTLNRWKRTKLKCDGILGIKTLENINDFVGSGNKLAGSYRTDCAIFYNDLVAKNPAFAKYKQGWLKRAYSIPG